MDRAAFISKIKPGMKGEYKNCRKFLIFDFGASNGRASVASFNGSRFELETVHRFDNVPVHESGILCWDIFKLYDELKTGLKAACTKYKDIVSLGIDTWGVDFGFIDKNGKLISNPEHYRDKKRFDAVPGLFSVIPKRELFNLTGGLILPVSGIFHIYNLKKRKAVQYLNAHKFLMVPDLFNYFLTGNTFNEYTEATTSIMVNQVSGSWEKEILKKLDIPENIFCEIVKPGTHIGNLCRGLIEELKIPSIKVIAPASHDTASAVAGMPITGESDINKTLIVSLGTWGIIIKEVKNPIISEAVFKKGFANEAGAEDTTMLATNITGLWIIQQCMGRWRREYGQDFDWRNVDDLYLQAPAFKSFIDVDDPVFSGVSPDMTETLANYFKAKKQYVPCTVGEISRILYENLVFKVKSKLIDIEKITGIKINNIHIVGGGSRNKLFCQWMADASGLHVAAGPTETTSIGNLIMQLKAAGEIKSLKEGRKISNNSSDVHIFEPDISNRTKWDEHFNKYLKFINN